MPGADRRSRPVLGLRATLLPGGDAHKDADHWLALHACVFGAAHDVRFELICAPRDDDAGVLQLRSLLPLASEYLSSVFVVNVEANRFAVVSVSAPVQVLFMPARSASTSSSTAMVTTSSTTSIGE